MRNGIMQVHYEGDNNHNRDRIIINIDKSSTRILAQDTINRNGREHPLSRDIDYHVYI
jgi:hypothetical protein